MAVEVDHSDVPLKDSLLWGMYPSLGTHCCVQGRPDLLGSQPVTEQGDQRCPWLHSAKLLHWAVCILGLSISLALNFLEQPCSLRLFLPSLPSLPLSFMVSDWPWNHHLYLVHFIFLKFNFVYLFLCSFFGWVLIAGSRLSLVAVSWDHSLIAEPRLLTAVASPPVVHGFSCPVVCGLFPDQGLNPCPLHGQVGS